MATRIARKPDPAIKRNVRRARAGARNAKTAHASVVVSSLAATIIAWAMFSYQDAQALQAAQVANSGEAAVRIVAPAQVTPQSALLRLPVPPFISVVVRYAANETKPVE